MRRLLLKTNLVLLFALATSVSSLRAETVNDSNLGFALNIAPEFVPRPDLVGTQPDVIHAFEFGEAKDGEIPVLLLIEKMGGVIGRERLTKEHMPLGFKGDLFVTTWQKFEVDGIIVPEKLNGIDVVTYNVQIPLKPQAIQIKLFGRADQDKTLRPRLRQVLDGLNGQSNWFTSVLPPSIASWEHYGAVLICLSIGGIIAGIVGLWYVSRSSPKAVLVIAFSLYIVSWQLPETRIREMKLLSGSMRMLGFAGIIIGVTSYLLQKRKSKNAVARSHPPDSAIVPLDH